MRWMVIGTIAVLLGGFIWISPLAAQQLSPNSDVAVELEMARKLSSERKFAEAEELLRVILQRDPSHAYAQYQLATVLSWDGKYAESIEAYRKLLVLEPSNINLHMEIGRVLLWNADRTNNDGDRQAALAEFETVIRARPNDCEAAKAIGATQLRLGRFSEARRVLEQQTVECPDDLEAQRLLGQSQAGLGQYDSARNTLAALLAKDTTNPDLRWLAAEYAVRDGDLNDAAYQYSTLLKKYPRHIESLMSLGRIRLWQGQLAQADRYLTSAYQLDEKRPDVQCALAELKLRQERYRSAATLSRNTLTQEPGNLDASKILDNARWLAGPGMQPTFRYFDASPGLDYQETGGTGWWMPLDKGTIEAAYERWEFMDPNTTRLQRNDYRLKGTSAFLNWLKLDAALTYSDFVKSAGSTGSRLGWSAGLYATTGKWLSWSSRVTRQPMSESYSTIAANYYADIVSSELDLTAFNRLTFSTAGSYAWRRGSFVVGYWNQYHRRWVNLATAEDRSRQLWLEAAASVHLVSSPSLHIRASLSRQKTTHAMTLPYWAPGLFREERLSLIVGHGLFKGHNLGLTVYGSHVHEGKEWGYGGSLDNTWRPFHQMELCISASYARAATDVPWNGKGLAATLRVRP